MGSSLELDHGFDALCFSLALGEDGGFLGSASEELGGVVLPIAGLAGPGACPFPGGVEGVGEPVEDAVDPAGFSSG